MERAGLRAGRDDACGIQDKGLGRFRRLNTYAQGRNARKRLRGGDERPRIEALDDRAASIFSVRHHHERTGKQNREAVRLLAHAEENAAFFYPDAPRAKTRQKGGEIAFGYSVEQSASPYGRKV